MTAVSAPDNGSFNNTHTDQVTDIRAGRVCQQEFIKFYFGGADLMSLKGTNTHPSVK